MIPMPALLLDLTVTPNHHLHPVLHLPKNRYRKSFNTENKEVWLRLSNKRDGKEFSPLDKVTGWITTNFTTDPVVVLPETW